MTTNRQHEIDVENPQHDYQRGWDDGVVDGARTERARLFVKIRGLDPWVLTRIAEEKLIAALEGDPDE